MSAVILHFPVRKRIFWRAQMRVLAGTYFDVSRFDYQPQFLPIPSPVTPRFGDTGQHGHHGLRQILETDQGDISRDAGITRGSVAPPNELGLGGVHDVRRQGDWLIELDHHMCQEVGVQCLQHGHATAERKYGGIAFFVRHVILRGLISRIKAFWRGRVE